MGRTPSSLVYNDLINSANGPWKQMLNEVFFGDDVDGRRRQGAGDACSRSSTLRQLALAERRLPACRMTARTASNRPGHPAPIAYGPYHDHSTQQPSGRHGSRPTAPASRAAAQLVGPSLRGAGRCRLVLLFFVIPLGMTFWMSLHNWPLLGRARFIGFDNYVRLAAGCAVLERAALHRLLHGDRDGRDLRRRLSAGALRREDRGRSTKFYRTAFFLPVVVGFGSASLLWAWLLERRFRACSPRLAYRLGLTEKPVNLLADFDTDLLVDHRHGRVEDGRLQHDHPAHRPAGHPDRSAGGGAHGRRLVAGSASAGSRCR